MGFGLKGFRGTEGEERSNRESINKDKWISKDRSKLRAACSQLRLAVLDIYHYHLFFINRNKNEVVSPQRR